MKMTMIRLNSESGFATLVALIMVGMLTLIGLASLSTSDDEVTIAGNELQEMRAFYAAEAGLEKIAAEIQDIFDSTGAPPTTLPYLRDSINGCVVFCSGSDNGPASPKVLGSGTLTGLNADVKSFTLRSVGSSNIENAQVVLTQSFESIDIPVFQWTLFFNDDFYSRPGGDISIGGRVHTNGDMYVHSTGSKLTFDDQVTVAGDVQHGFPWGAPGGGDVFFTDASGNPVNMKQGGVWIDSDHANWYDTAAALWQGKLQDHTFGQNKLTLGLNAGDDPHKIIERSAGNPDSYQDKADFMILDGIPMALVGGIWQDVSASLPVGTITEDPTVKFYDAKEQKTVRNTQIDIKLLKGSAYWPKDDIVIYISDQRAVGGDMRGTTLINGSEVGVPATIVCENPLYIQGDFNSTKKQPVAAISDALTFLSNNWNPALSTDPLVNRAASKTIANLAIVTGDVEPVDGNYGGGMENLPRFLEDWAGQDFDWTGALVQMWHSREANGTYRDAADINAYYTDPTRNWKYDTDLSNPSLQPPGAPTIRLFLRTGWNQDYVGL